MANPLLRWLGALLAGSAACYLTWLLTSLALLFLLPSVADETTHGLGRLLLPALPHAAAAAGGAVFVYVAARMAPPHPRRPIVALVAFIVILGALVLTGVLAFPTGRLWVDLTAMLLGAGATAGLLSFRRMSPSRV